MQFTFHVQTFSKWYRRIILSHRKYLLECTSTFSRALRSTDGLCGLGHKRSYVLNKCI